MGSRVARREGESQCFAARLVEGAGCPSLFPSLPEKGNGAPGGAGGLRGPHGRVAKPPGRPPRSGAPTRLAWMGLRSPSGRGCESRPEARACGDLEACEASPPKRCASRRSTPQAEPAEKKAALSAARPSPQVSPRHDGGGPEAQAPSPYNYDRSPVKNKKRTECRRPAPRIEALTLPRLRLGVSKRLIDDAPDGFRAARQVRLLAAPVVEAFQEFRVHADIDLWIL
jgi:hypothetical protein